MDTVFSVGRSTLNHCPLLQRKAACGTINEEFVAPTLRAQVSAGGGKGICHLCHVSMPTDWGGQGTRTRGKMGANGFCPHWIQDM